MERSGGEGEPVKTKAVLIDPVSMTVVWMNEAAAHDARDPGSAVGAPFAEANPMPDVLRVPEALREVATTGVPRHLRTGLVSTARGSLAVVVSIYRLPDGMLLMLSDNAWAAEHSRPTGERPRRGGRPR